MINNGEEFPFITIAPQCPAFQWWPEPVYVKTLISLVEEIINNYKVDTARIYATGLSMGGYGTLAIAKERPDLFSAIIPVCGGMDTTEIRKLKNIPIWLFHVDADEVDVIFIKDSQGTTYCHPDDNKSAQLPPRCADSFRSRDIQIISEMGLQDFE